MFRIIRSSTFAALLLCAVILLSSCSEKPGQETLESKYDELRTIIETDLSSIDIEGRSWQAFSFHKEKRTMFVKESGIDIFLHANDYSSLDGNQFRKVSKDDLLDCYGMKPVLISRHISSALCYERKVKSMKISPIRKDKKTKGYFAVVNAQLDERIWTLSQEEDEENKGDASLKVELSGYPIGHLTPGNWQEMDRGSQEQTVAYWLSNLPDMEDNACFLNSFLTTDGSINPKRRKWAGNTIVKCPVVSWKLAKSTDNSVSIQLNWNSNTMEWSIKKYERDGVIEKNTFSDGKSPDFKGNPKNAYKRKLFYDCIYWEQSSNLADSLNNISDGNIYLFGFWQSPQNISKYTTVNEGVTKYIEQHDALRQQIENRKGKKSILDLELLSELQNSIRDGESILGKIEQLRIEFEPSDVLEKYIQKNNTLVSGSLCEEIKDFFLIKLDTDRYSDISSKLDLIIWLTEKKRNLTNVVDDKSFMRLLERTFASFPQNSGDGPDRSELIKCGIVLVANIDRLTDSTKVVDAAQDSIARFCPQYIEKITESIIQSRNYNHLLYWDAVMSKCRQKEGMLATSGNRIKQALNDFEKMNIRGVPEKITLEYLGVAPLKPNANAQEKMVFINAISQKIQYEAWHGWILPEDVGSIISWLVKENMIVTPKTNLAQWNDDIPNQSREFIKAKQAHDKKIKALEEEAKVKVPFYGPGDTIECVISGVMQTVEIESYDANKEILYVTKSGKKYPKPIKYGGINAKFENIDPNANEMARKKLIRLRLKTNTSDYQALFNNLCIEKYEQLYKENVANGWLHSAVAQNGELFDTTESAGLLNAHNETQNQSSETIRQRKMEYLAKNRNAWEKPENLLKSIISIKTSAIQAQIRNEKEQFLNTRR